MGRCGDGGTPQPAVSLIEISRVLEDSARLIREHVAPPLGSQMGGASSGVTAAEVRAIIAARWLRREYLGADANDAGWAMILQLYAARLEGRRVSQTMLGVTAAVPQTTALRVIGKFVAKGILLRESDSDDARLQILSLSDQTARRVSAYLAATRRIIHAA